MSKPKKLKKEKVKSFSLVSASGMGGIVGGKGYDFQSRYIACHVPEWLLDGRFSAILPEGTGDVDVYYGRGKKQQRKHIQIKDHPVTKKSEFKVIIEAFDAFDKDMPDVYQHFILACPSIGPVIQPLKNALKRLRDAKGFYKGKLNALDPTIRDIKERISNLNLSKYQELIIEKLDFHIGLTDFHNDEVACIDFALKLMEHPEYSEKVIKFIKPGYYPLLHEVTNKRGKVLNRISLKSLIDNAIKEGGAIPESAVDVDIHNWEFAKYERTPKHTLDWSAHFDRQLRIVPDAKTWNEELVPQLYNLKKEIIKNTDLRLIRFRGKCTLTTGIALGAAFPQNGNWVFEIQQPPQLAAWRSSASPEMSYELNFDEEININRNANKDVETYIRNESIPVKKVITVRPEGGSGLLSIANDREAVSLALLARDKIRSILTDNSVHKTHLFFYGPFALSVFLGQLLTSIGTIQLYEYKDPSYMPSALIRT